MLRFAILVSMLLLAGCQREAGNPAPPRVDTAFETPKQTSTIVAPLSLSLDELEARLNAVTPQRLWSIDRQEARCVPAQKVSICAVHVRKCKGDECRNVPCKIGLKRTRVTPDIACRIVGQVTRGRLSLTGRGDTLAVSLPVKAVVSAHDVGGVIKKETATGAANVRATVRLTVDRNWQPRAKVDIAYDWTEPPGVDILGQRVRFVSRADKALAGVVAGLERDVTREIQRQQSRALVEQAWKLGFATILLNRERPPAWMRLTPQRLGFGGYRVSGRQLELTLAAETLTETFIGDRPEPPRLGPLPPPAASIGNRGFRVNVPVLADYAQLEPVVSRALGKLAKKGVTLPRIGAVNVEFGKVTIYPTAGGRIAVGIETKADVVRSPLKATKGEVWLSALPYNDANSQVVRVRDLKIAERSDRQAVDLLVSLYLDPVVLGEIQQALTHDFAPDFDKVLLAARKAIALRREGDFTFAANIDKVSHGTVVATGSGLYLPVEVTGNARILYAPRRRR